MDADFIVIGGGIAGASAAYELAARGSVVLLERESQPGYHTTGRSAAMFLETYGGPVVQRFAQCSKDFLFTPPEGFCEGALVSPRGVVLIARDDQRDTRAAAIDGSGGAVEAIDTARAIDLVPVLRPDYVAAASLERDASDIDVHAVHHGFLRAMQARGGRIVTDAEVTAIKRESGAWRLVTAAGDFTAPVVVNAAGAWADVVAGMAGVAPVGLTPCRRTAIGFDGPPGVDASGWHMVIDVDEQFYFKPDAGRFMGSPSDETPMAPCDVQPDEMDIAVAVDRIQRATTFDIRRLTHRWAGLRSFVADHLPVVGYDPDVEGFFWLAGQGGIGIMTSPAMARLAASLAAREDLPDDLRAHAIDPAALAPERLRS